MFAYIEGILDEIEDQSVILRVGGIGFEIRVTQSLIARLPEKGSQVRLYTYFNVREDIQELYGFYNLEEKSVFKKLITVSGIGPRVGIGILSSLTATEIVTAIATNDIKTLCTAPGVGKKTAQKIVLELKDKVDQKGLKNQNISQSDYSHRDYESQVIEALTALGYQVQDAKRAFNSIKDKDQDVSTLIKLSLKLMDRG